jgi:flavin-dependent dehydrogenase
MYDVIVVGARVAGSATAMLLARRGYRVLVVDRATFPSDTLSTHNVLVPGGAWLRRWGLLERVQATNCPPIRRVTFDLGPFALRGSIPPLDGVDAVHSPRRTLLDQLLVDAAREAGAEAREGFGVEEVLLDGDRAVGIRGRSRGGAPMVERAPLVVGADGMRSTVARAVAAPSYDTRPALSCAYYAYFADVQIEGGEIAIRDGRAIGAWPTNDGLTVVYTAWPASEFHRYRADVEGNFARTLALAPGLAERVRRGRREGRFLGTADLPNFHRRPYGPGWALVGDAGYHRDPITALGISDAFRDAELLAGAIDAGRSGRRPPEEALAAYERRRNALSRPWYELTTRLAALAPTAPHERILFEALRANQAATDQFIGVLAGSVAPQDFFAPGSLARIAGLRGLARIAFHRLPAARRRSA